MAQPSGTAGAMVGDSMPGTIPIRLPNSTKMKIVPKNAR